MIPMKVEGFSPKEEKHWRGILISFLDANLEVLTGKRKGSYIVQFCRERLNRGEQKDLLILLRRLQSQLLQGKTGAHKASVDYSTGVNQLPKVVHDLLQQFQ